ncbi:hypothetical protein FACS189494_08370 [Spirochaetia bacterium]|nr:hypothetical protein FACS189494_08370 [Spirochaetia bacterium]
MNNLKSLFCFLVSLSVFVSCGTLTMHYKTIETWSMNGDAENYKTIKLGIIAADKPGGSFSIENEIAKILPLVFLENGYVLVNNDSDSDYVVDVYAIERDYFEGWESKKSVSMEVLVWQRNISGSMNVGTNKAEIPVAAGKVIAQGSQGLSVSNNLNNILRKSALNAILQIEKL